MLKQKAISDLMTFTSVSRPGLVNIKRKILYFYIRGFAAQLLEKGRKGLNSSMFLSSLWNVKERLDVASP